MDGKVSRRSRFNWGFLTTSLFNFSHSFTQTCVIQKEIVFTVVVTIILSSLCHDNFKSTSDPSHRVRGLQDG